MKSHSDFKSILKKCKLGLENSYNGNGFRWSLIRGRWLHLPCLSWINIRWRNHQVRNVKLVVFNPNSFQKEARVEKHEVEYHFLLLVVKPVTTGFILSVLELLIQMNASSEKMFPIIVRPVLNRKNNKRFLIEKQSQALPAKKAPKGEKHHLPKNMKLKHR